LFGRRKSRKPQPLKSRAKPDALTKTAAFKSKAKAMAGNSSPGSEGAGVSKQSIRDAGCREVRMHFAAYLAGETAATEKKAVETHLSSCPQCRTALQQEERLSRALTEVLRPQVNPDYWQHLWPRIQVALAERRRPAASGVLRWALAGAGAAAAVASLLFFLLTRPPTAPTLAQHDPSYFSNLPDSPPTLLEETAEQRFSLELASLAMGQPTPTQRAIIRRGMEGL